MGMKKTTKRRKLLLHAWVCTEYNGSLFLPYTHWIYLKEICNYFDEIVLLSPCRKVENLSSIHDLSDFKNVVVYKLPDIKNYANAFRFFFKYLYAYLSINDVTHYYTRYPTPFGWLALIPLIISDKESILHYVGSPLDVWKNKNTSRGFKYYSYYYLFKFEDFLYRLLAKKSRVYTNGPFMHLNLLGFGVNSSVLISSTLLNSDYQNRIESVNFEELKFLYFGYLRPTKGLIELVLAFEKFSCDYPKSSLVIIGSGDFEKKLKSFAISLQPLNIKFIDHIDNRDVLLTYLRSNDIFILPSLSEGSPRSVLEAMANSLVVIASEVGSLPDTFFDEEDILFIKNNSPNAIYERMLFISKNKDLFYKIRSNAFNKSKLFSLKMFIKEIFHA